MKLINSDCIIAMKEMPDNSVDSIVTDPPYELGFMGKSWDSTGIANSVEMWSQALRVLKPGGHLIAFSGSRTYHRMAVAIEDAGFEIRDQIMWVYGSGFPKSLNIGKQLDDWDGWGTALKPAHEPMVLARKPLVGTVVNNVMTYGVGGLNIDKSRVGTEDTRAPASKTALGMMNDDNWQAQEVMAGSANGRFPANFIHDGSDEVVELFPDTKTGSIKPYKHNNTSTIYGGGKGLQLGTITANFTGDSGSAARFFYCAKTSKADRNEGLDGFEEKAKVFNGQSDKPSGNAKGSVEDKFSTQPSANNHPTVKPTELMRYLVRLITPPNGLVLDPFMGSGSTGKACAYEGFDFIGIDQSAEYVEIARARIEFALHQEATKEMELPF
jgi:site-specific DNA-methyltransferase (adenine-specific)